MGRGGTLHIMRTLSLPGGDPIQAGPGDEVVCVVPYDEARTGFDEGARIRVQTTLGWAAAVMQDHTQVSYFHALSAETAERAGFESGLQAAEHYNVESDSLAAIVRFRVGEVLAEETTWQKIRRVLNL